MIENQSKLVKKLKKHKIVLSTESNLTTPYDKEDIKKILPHRDPFLLVDRITKIDLTERSVEVSSCIDINNPVFTGHFPGNPVYPGVLQIETMGQAGLCLAYFAMQKTTSIPTNTVPITGLFTKIHYTGFFERIFPGDSINVLVKMVEYDEFLGIISGQLVRDGQICSCAILETFFTE